MGEESARLRREIEQTREDLTRDVDLLAEKTSPSAIVDRRVRRTRSRISGLKDRVMGSVGSHDDAYDTYGYGEPSFGAPYAGSQGTSGSSSGGSSVRDSAQQALGGAQERLQGAAGSVSSSAHGAVDTARQQTEGNPLAAGLVAFGVGWLVSSLLPASDAEQRAARQAAQAAQEHGVVDQAKQAAQEVGQNLQGTAQEAVQQVKDRAQEGVEEVRSTGQDSAQHVKEEARSAT